ncbi:Sec-independent protein translocase protein TatB [Raoultella terrigena]|uniref:Sec-independent protein translocase protein TatB n=1 Tax=Raoultella terrigena TaxID=577 RepID=A0A4U9D5G4_RAOTE|nr:Sec-independent protein translocase protein TatB [Raoultella terrigena]
MKRSYSAHDPEKASDEANTIHNPVVKGSEEQRQDITPATAEHQASAPVHAPASAVDEPLTPSSELPEAKEKAAVKATDSSPASSDKPVNMGVDDTQPLISHLIELA